MFRGNAAHSGVFQTKAPKNLGVKWVFDTATSPDLPGEAIIGSPVVAGGVVYVGSNDNNLYAIDACSGKLKWKFATTGGLRGGGGNVASTPAVSGNIVYFMCNDGNFYAVDATTGKVRWTYATAGEHRCMGPGMLYAQPVNEIGPDLWDFYLSSPAILDGAVYFGCGDGNVYSLDAASGALRWKFPTGNVVHASPAVANGTVYIGSFDSYFYALDAATGSLRWKFQTGVDLPSHLMMGLPGSAAVANGVVYFGCRDSNFYALDAQTGRQRWAFNNGGSWVIASPAVQNNIVYFVTSDSHKFEALDAQTGAELYSLPYNIFAFSSPAIAGDRAYFGAFDGLLHEVNLTDRRYSGKYAVPGYSKNKEKWLKPDGQLNDNIWTGETMDDAFYNIRAKMFTLGSILSSPTVSDGVVYFSSVDGRVYALGE